MKKRDYDFLLDSRFNRKLLYFGENLYNKLEKLYFLPILLFLLSLSLIVYKIFFGFNMDYTITGGVKFTLIESSNFDVDEFRNFFSNLKVEKEGNIYVIFLNNQQLYLKKEVESFFNKKNIKYNVEEISPFIGQNWQDFLKRFFLILLLSFVLVFISLWAIFKNKKLAFIGSRALFFNLIITFSLTNLLIPLSKYIIPAYLMIIGYSIDTNIILINSMLKEKKFDLKKRYALAFNTGIIIHLTTLSALLIGILLSNNYVFKVIFLVLFIALLVDLIDTWILNGYLLKKFFQTN